MTGKDLPARWHIKIDRATRLEQQQNAALIALLQWAHDTYGSTTPGSHREPEQQT